METKFNFNSQVCTDVNQSRRLLALGLKKETADMSIGHTGLLYPYPHREEEDRVFIPAWSLARLVELLPYSIERHGKNWTLEVSKGYVRYGKVGTEKVYVGFIQKLDTYDAIIDCIEWLIKDGDFNKEYLV